MQHSQAQNRPFEGIILIDKPKGITSFRVIHLLRKRFHVKKIGHTGTLDPFATGLLVVLVGRNFTKKADEFVQDDKEYLATLHLGAQTDTFDSEGQVQKTSDILPTLEDVERVVAEFQGTIQQLPPMFSAKKIGGKKLYELARKGIEVERRPCSIQIETKLIRYEYPEIDIHVTCSKGCYIRSVGNEIGEKLGCLAYVKELRRIRSGKFRIEDSVPLQTG